MVVIVTLMAALPSAWAEEQASLKAPLSFSLLVGGKKIGETKVAAGTLVTVVKRDGSRVLVRHGASQEKWVEQTQLAGIEQHNPEADYKTAKALFEEEDQGDNWTRAAGLMRRSAEAGFPAAQREWGIMLMDGFCAPQDADKGEALLREAADAGDSRAMLWSVFGGEGDTEKFREGVKRAADKGDALATAQWIALNDGIPDGDGRNYADWVSDVLASSDAEAITAAAMTCLDWARNSPGDNRVGMTTDELNAKALQGFRLGCKAGMLEAYTGLANMLRKGTGTEKNEAQSDALLAEFRRRAEQRIARGSFSTRLRLIEGLRVSGQPDDPGETIRQVEEVLEKSSYVGHYTLAAALGARACEGEDPRNSENLRRALDWLKDWQAKKNIRGIAHFIEGYEKRLADAMSATNEK